VHKTVSFIMFILFSRQSPACYVLDLFVKEYFCWSPLSSCALLQPQPYNLMPFCDYSSQSQALTFLFTCSQSRQTHLTQRFTVAEVTSGSLSDSKGLNIKESAVLFSG